MKKLILVLIIGFLITSCKPSIEYDIDYVYIVSDSLKIEHREYLLDLVKAASHKNAQSAGKARNLDDVIYAAQRISNHLYEEKVEVVTKTYRTGDGSYKRRDIIKIEDLNKDKDEVYIYYKILETGKPYKIKLSRK